MRWKRRGLEAALAAVAACKGAAPAPNEAAPKTDSPSSAPPPVVAAEPDDQKASLPVPSQTPPNTNPNATSTSTNQDPGYTVARGPGPLTFDGDKVYELRDGEVIERDRSLAEVDRVPLTHVVAFAPLADHSLVVSTKDGKDPQTHHVVDGVVTTTYLGEVEPLVGSEMADQFYRIDGRHVYRDRFGVLKNGPILLPVENFDLPEGPQGSYARLTNGDLVVATQSALVRCTAKKATVYEWDGFSRHVGPGPDENTVWVSDTLGEIVLVKLSGAVATEKKRIALAKDETILHLTSSGDRVAAIVAVRTGSKLEWWVVAWTERGEQWRQKVGDKRAIYYVAMNAKQVVVRSEPNYELRGFDAATGKPL